MLTAVIRAGGRGPKHPDRRRRHFTDRRHAAGRSQRLSSGRGRCTPIAGGVISPIVGTRPDGSYDCQLGGGPVHPDRLRRHLAVFRPVGWTVKGHVFTDCHPGGEPLLPDRCRFARVISLPSAGPRPARHRRLLPGRVQLQPDHQECVYTWDADTRPSRASDSLLASGPRARGRADDSDVARAGPRGPRFDVLALATDSDVFSPGPSGPQVLERYSHLVQEWRAGRCGVLTLILVGTVRTCRSRRAGPAPRIPDLERTIRSYDVAAAGFPLFAPIRGHCDRYARVTCIAVVHL